MKALVLTVMLASLYLLYRIACPKSAQGTKQENDIPPNRETQPDNGIGKSRYVPTFQRQPQPIPASVLESENQEVKPLIFAPETGKSQAMVTPGELDEIFEDEPNPADLDIPPDEEADEPDWDAEAEELQTLGRDADMAEGLSIEEMTEAAKAIDKPSDENAKLLLKVEPTDMFEQMVSGDEEKAAQIRAIIDRNVQRLNPETEEEKSDNDGEWKKFNIADFLS